MIEIQPPMNARPSETHNRVQIFLAGTIDNGNSKDWQRELIEANAELDVVFYNPRRNEWDSTWVQSAKNQMFKEQVNWELDHLEEADLVIFNFEAGSKSPITIGELGLSLPKYNKTLIVCCPEGYERKGNIDIMCERHGVPVFEKIEELYPIIKYFAYKKKREITCRLTENDDYHM